MSICPDFRHDASRWFFTWTAAWKHQQLIHSWLKLSTILTQTKIIMLIIQNVQEVQ